MNYFCDSQWSYCSVVFAIVDVIFVSVNRLSPTASPQEMDASERATEFYRWGTKNTHATQFVSLGFVCHM